MAEYTINVPRKHGPLWDIHITGTKQLAPGTRHVYICRRAAATRANWWVPYDNSLINRKFGTSQRDALSLAQWQLHSSTVEFYWTVVRLHHDFEYQGGCVFVVVCLSLCLLATLRKNFRTNFSRNFQGRLAMARYLRHCWEIRKVANEHSFILVRQIVALVRRALAEVCTVPVLLVFSVRVPQMTDTFTY